MVKRILLDLDDVCNKFTMSALKYVGCEVEIDDTSCFPKQYGYDIVGAANFLSGYKKFTVPSFWDSIPRSFWATIPPSEEYTLLLELCEDLVGRENVALLTSPTIDPECLAGKLMWIHDHTPKWLHRQFLVGPCKQFCAHPESLLIDDADKNVNKFRAWGGNALLVPRPWNTLNGITDTASYIRERFKELKPRPQKRTLSFF